MRALACFMEEVRLDNRVCLGSGHVVFLLCVGDRREKSKGGSKGEGKKGKEKSGVVCLSFLLSACKVQALCYHAS